MGGSPSYFSTNSLALAFKKRLISSLNDWEVLVLKKWSFYHSLSSVPMQIHKHERISLVTQHSDKEALQMSKLSSANNRWVI